MADDPAPGKAELEALAREWLHRFETRKFDGAQLSEGFPLPPPGRGLPVTTILGFLNEPKIEYVASETNDRGMTRHRFRIHFEGDLEYQLGFRSDGKLNQFSLKPLPDDVPRFRRYMAEILD